MALPLAVALGRILQQHREASGVTRRQLAQHVELAPNTLREVELGLGNPTLGRVEHLAKLYGIELALVAASGPVAAVTPARVPRAQ